MQVLRYWTPFEMNLRSEIWRSHREEKYRETEKYIYALSETQKRHTHFSQRNECGGKRARLFPATAPGRLKLSPPPLFFWHIASYELGRILAARPQQKTSLCSPYQEQTHDTKENNFFPHANNILQEVIIRRYSYRT